MQFVCISEAQRCINWPLALNISEVLKVETTTLLVCYSCRVELQKKILEPRTTKTYQKEVMAKIDLKVGSIGFYVR